MSNERGLTRNVENGRARGKICPKADVMAVTFDLGPKWPIQSVDNENVWTATYN